MSDDLTPETGRWTATVKEAILLDIRAGKLTIESACEKYGLSGEEIASWAVRYDSGGRDALKPTKRAHA